MLCNVSVHGKKNNVNLYFINFSQVELRIILFYYRNYT